MKLKAILFFILTILVVNCQKTTSIKRDEEKNTKNEVSDFHEVRIPSNLLYYYQNIDFSKNGNALYEDLSTLTIAKHTNILQYNGSRHNYLKKSDADLQDKSKIVLIYTGEKRDVATINRSVNTEHVFPRSFLKKSGNVQGIADLHHLRYCDQSVNSERADKPFTDGKGQSKSIGRNAWYPGDQWKGDVARMMLYLKLRYNENMGKVSTNDIDLFLKWNAQDPVSDFEKQRNNEIEKAQGNRNPFIDNPYLATKIWKGISAENRWK